MRISGIWRSRSPNDEDPYNFDHVLDGIKDQMVEGETYSFDKRGRLVRDGRKKYSQEGVIKLPKLPVGQSRGHARGQIGTNRDPPRIMANDRRVRLTSAAARGYDMETRSGYVEYIETTVGPSHGLRGINHTFEQPRHHTEPRLETSHHSDLSHHGHTEHGYGNNNSTTSYHGPQRTNIPAPPTNQCPSNATRRTFQRVPDASLVSRDTSSTSGVLGNQFKHGDGRFQVNDARTRERPTTSAAESQTNHAQSSRNELGHCESNSVESPTEQNNGSGVGSFAPRPPGARYPRTRNNDPAFIPAPPTSKPAEQQSYSKTRRRVKYRNQELDQDVSVHRTTVRESFMPEAPLHEVPDTIDQQLNEGVEMQKQFTALNARLDHLKKKCEVNISCSGIEGKMTDDDANDFIDDLDDILESTATTGEQENTHNANFKHDLEVEDSKKIKPLTAPMVKASDENDIENIDALLGELDDIIQSPFATRSQRKSKKPHVDETDALTRELDDMLDSPMPDNKERSQKRKQNDADVLIKDLDEILYSPTQFRPNSVAIANTNVTECSTPIRMPAAAQVPRMTAEPLKQWNGETAKRGVGFKSKLRREDVKVRRPEDDIVPDRVRRRMQEYNKTRKNV